MVIYELFFDNHFKKFNEFINSKHFMIIMKSEWFCGEPQKEDVYKGFTVLNYESVGIIKKFNFDELKIVIHGFTSEGYKNVPVNISSMKVMKLYLEWLIVEEL